MATGKKAGRSDSKLEDRIAVLEELFLRLSRAGAVEGPLGSELENVSVRPDDIAGPGATSRVPAPGGDDLEDRRIQNIVAALVSPDPDATSVRTAEPGTSRGRTRTRS